MYTDCTFCSHEPMTMSWETQEDGTEKTTKGKTYYDTFIKQKYRYCPYCGKELKRGWIW